MKKDDIKKIVKKHYSNVAQKGCSCNCGKKDENVEISKSLGYSDEEIKSVSSANLGLGCGNPIALANINKGDIILDLGSGAGFDTFLAAKKLAGSGKVIGVDMTKKMIEMANNNAKKYGYKNVEFKLGDIENLPVDDNSIDIIISNCVINLAPDKIKVFKEVFRVLKNGGKMYVSDMVLLGNLTNAQKENEYLIAGCVGGAILKNDYIDLIKKAGFRVKVLSEDKDISKRQYQNMPVESLKIEAIK